MTAERTIEDVVQDIVDVLDGTVWSSETTDQIARILRDHGYIIRDRNDYVYLAGSDEAASDDGGRTDVDSAKDADSANVLAWSAVAAEEAAQRRADNLAPTDEERCELVVRGLGRLGWDDVYSEHSGGGIFCVYIPDARFGDERWIFGMANETWAGHRIDAAGVNIDETEVETSVPSDASDPAALEQVAIDIDRILRNL